MFSRNRLRKIKWLIFGRPDVPPIGFEVNPKISEYTNLPYWPRYYSFALLYNGGMPIELIAKKYNVTRERVRQCLWKAYRNNEVRVLNGKNI